MRVFFIFASICQLQTYALIYLHENSCQYELPEGPLSRKRDVRRGLQRFCLKSFGSEKEGDSHIQILREVRSVVLANRPRVGWVDLSGVESNSLDKHKADSRDALERHPISRCFVVNKDDMFCFQQRFALVLAHASFGSCSLARIARAQ